MRRKYTLGEKKCQDTLGEKKCQDTLGEKNVKLAAELRDAKGPPLRTGRGEPQGPGKRYLTLNSMESGNTPQPQAAPMNFDGPS